MMDGTLAMDWTQGMDWTQAMGGRGRSLGRVR